MLPKRGTDSDLLKITSDSGLVQYLKAHEIPFVTLVHP